MKRIRIFHLCLSCLIIGFSGCRTRPELDLGYKPQSYDYSISESSMNGANSDGDLNEHMGIYLEDSFDFNLNETRNDDWKLFTAEPMPSRNVPIEEVEDRNWGPIHFALNQSFIGETERKKLELLADYLTRNTRFITIIEGHCDKRGSDEYNRSLGEKRAIAVRDYLTSLGVNDSRMQTLSYGEEKLIDNGETEKAHTRNRRVEFIIGLSK